MGLQRKTPQAKASTNSTVEYENVAEGSHEGRLVMVADLGLHKRDYNGEEKSPCQKISLGIELIGQTLTVDGVAQPRVLWTNPFNIFQTLNEMGKELPMFRVFQPLAKEGQVANWESVLGVACDVIVRHEVSGDRTYDNIESIAPIPTRYQDGVADATHPMGIGDSEDENNPVTKGLYGLTKWMHSNRITAASEVVSEASAEKGEDFKDDIPF